MKIPRSWLESFVTLDFSDDELREIFDDLGLVVEGIEPVGEGLADVVVARVLRISPIEGADRIRLVHVDDGTSELEIVCGAMNFTVGDVVPLAPVGAVLPGGFEIARRKMRGVESNGMLCSARELRLSDDHEGLMILDPSLTPGEPLLEALGLVADVVFDISVEGNRPDAWCVEGIARDLATRLRRPLRAPATTTVSSATLTSTLAQAQIDAPDLCGRLVVSLLRDVRVAPSPQWIQRRLESAGMRAINNVVDASNVVMLELGQPTHPYDAARIARRTLRVRRARSGESLVTLDGATRVLAQPGRGLGDTGEDCVIVDGDDVVLGLAGIMGGASSEISESTTEVLLEAAHFDSMAIARSSKRHGLRTEASARFERGVDPELPPRAVARFVELLRESSPDLEWLAEPLDMNGERPRAPEISFSARDVERLLGTRVDSDEVERILLGLDFAVQRDVDDFVVVAPSRRLDIREGRRGRADVIEEIARLFGYRSLERRTPSWSEPGGLSLRQRERRILRDCVVNLGALEVWTPSLVSESDFARVGDQRERIRIANPLASDEAVLRATLVTGLIDAWSRNVGRGLGDVVLAEFGTVFSHPNENEQGRTTRGGAGGAAAVSLPVENERLSILLGRPDDDARRSLRLWSSIANRLRLREVHVRADAALPPGWHPTRSGTLVDARTNAVVGVVGEVDPDLLEFTGVDTSSRRVGLVDLDLDVLLDHARVLRRSDLVEVPSRFPSATIDLAFVVPSTLNSYDVANILSAAHEFVEDVRLFDVYRGKGIPDGARSLAFAIRLGSGERTLSDDDVSNARTALIEAVVARGATLR